MVYVNEDVGRGGMSDARQDNLTVDGFCEELCAPSLNGDEERLVSVRKEEEPGTIGTSRADDDDDQGDRHTDDGMCQQLSALSLKCDEEREKPGKDPRKKARQYQLELCKKALDENAIVYLGTGCGKTHIAVLLIYEMGHLIKKPQKNICIFLAPTVALAHQQTKVIRESLDFNVGTYCGSSTHFKRKSEWDKELEEKEIFVMTPQILLHCLSHCWIKIELVALLIFDECHYAQLGSNHPYTEIMKIFYEVDSVKLPRIFGMTASPKLGKGASIDGLEALLRAKVYSVEDQNGLEKFVTSPKVKIYYYCSSTEARSSAQMTYITKLEEIKHQSISSLRVNSLDQSMLRSNKKLLQRLHSNLIFCLEGLGLWGALQATYNFSKTDYPGENNEPVEEEECYVNENLCKKYLQRATSVLASDCTADGTEGDLSSVEVLKVPYFSRKLLKLIEVLSNFRSQPSMKCIIFVNRIVTARSLSYIIQNVKLLSSWRCEFLVGVHSGFMSHNTTNDILEKFRSGELNLLVATKVGEEGLDIQTCCLVIRFDLPETVASFIQSRGRARMPQSEYAFLVDRDNPRELDLIEHFKEDETQMNEEISSRISKVPRTKFEEKTYKVDPTGATISSVSSVSLLHHYCSKLPHDEYFNPNPQFFYYEAGDEMVCHIILPANAPIHQIVGAPQASIEAAKKDACLEACRNLHQIGALTDYLLPEEYDKSDESTIDSVDSDENNEDSRAQLHKMLVPAALRKPWMGADDSTCFTSYNIKLCPNPADRVYRKFGLFVKEPLPEEAGKMKLDLCLVHGRMVMTQLVPSGVAIFDKDEVAAAEMFQKICLNVLLDRNAFTSEYVPLESSDVYEPSTSTFYLLLPVVENEYGETSVDWKLLKRFLSSPIFEQPHSIDSVTSQPGSYLHLANGCRSIQDVVDSLVYVPGKDVFFFVSEILHDKNGYSLYDESRSHVEHYAKLYDIHLAHPDQPLLRAKQLFNLDNLLRKKKNRDKWREKEEHFVELPPDICQLKVIGFSKDIGSSFSLLPSIMHRLESFLVAIELKDKLAASFPKGKEVTVDRILEAITTAKCSERFNLERLEVLGDAFLKLAVSRHLFLKHDALDEGQLTRKRSNLVNNSNLQRLAKKKNLHVKT